MRPILFHLFGYAVPSFAVFFALGFTTTFIWAFYEARRVGINPEKALEAGFWIFIGIIIGSRLFSFLFERETYGEGPLRFLRIWEGGMVLYGGAAGCIISCMVASKIMKLPLGEMADVVAQAGILGVTIGRVGCIFAGCCYGRPSEAAWCMRYTDPSSPAFQMVGNQCLYPAPVYSALWLLAVFLFLVWLSRRKSFPGQVAWSFYIVYPVGRFIIEFYRGDPRGFIKEPVLSRIFAPLLQNQTYTEPLGGFYQAPYLSTSQFLSIIVFIGALIGYIISKRRARRRLLQSGNNRDIS